MRTAAFLGRWYLLGTGFDGSTWWDEPGLGFLEGDVGQPLAFGFFLPVVGQRQVLWGSLHASVYGGFWRISCFSCLRGPHLEIWSIFSSRPCIWQSCFRCLGVVRGVQVLEFSGDAAFEMERNAWLDSEYMFCSCTSVPLEFAGASRGKMK